MIKISPVLIFLKQTPTPGSIPSVDLGSEHPCSVQYTHGVSLLEIEFTVSKNNAMASAEDLFCGFDHNF